MREGESDKHIALLNSNGDTIPNVFLNLQPELWNKERTLLTIWLDPGRIKRDLIPNQKMGNPIRKGEQYTLTVSANWEDVQGLHLKQDYRRKFIVGVRDSISPNPDQWFLKLPDAGTNQPLVIDIGDPLDCFLLQETIKILDKSGNRIAGTLKISHKETKCTFSPDKRWLSGTYRLQVASYLEDLAGNNLNKVFDRDISLKEIKANKINYERHFVLNP